METGKLLVVDTVANDLGGVAGDELDSGGGHTGLDQDLVDEVVGVCGSGGGLPDDDVADDRRGTDEVATDGGKVEGGDGEDKAF